MTKDDGRLLLVAVPIFLIAWAFWHYLGQRAFDVLGIIVLAALLGENWHLRKKLRIMIQNKIVSK
ncbi:hypothetical protein [Holophaga foetida]|uniref:hypothetical protein n=1 Tax=Holophaga foetida TaxID=35839 RepID=UPI00024725E4|nr:hypothetical protein [Holophaga foetida]